MTGEEFRRLMAEAGLSVRGAAEYLGVYTSRIQRWRDEPDERSAIPAWAVRALQKRIAAATPEQGEAMTRDADLSDQELAKMWLGYGFSHEALGKEVERRWPHLAGWKAAADYLSREHWNRWQEEQDRQETWDLNVLGPDDQDPGAVALMAQYRKSVQGIADGETDTSESEDSGLYP